MRILYTIIIFVAIFGCTRTNDSSIANSNKSDTLIVTANVIQDSFLDLNVLKFDTACCSFSETLKQSDLSEKEIKECEALLEAYIINYNKEIGKRRFDEMTKNNPNLDLSIKDFTVNLSNYGRQYMVGISDKGAKIVFVNGFCNPERFKSRDKELVYVFDGGNCYFNFKVNLTTKRIFDFWVNGWA